MQINIESCVSREHVGNIVHFLEALKEALKRGEAHHPQGLVLWYDACDIEGRVVHQSALNKFNEPFFAVRGSSASLVGELAALAFNRIHT
jgi:endo-beta-N-acetylglucosaminidase D